MKRQDIEEITEKSNKINLPTVFNPQTKEVLNDISFQSGVSIEFILVPLISSVSHFLNRSKIEMTDSHSENFLLYTALLANASTGKSPAMRIFTDAAYEIENKLGIEDSDSLIATGATVEATIELIKTLGPILSMYDESSSFIGSLGRYTNGGTNYDRSIYLNLFNGITINRDLKCGRTRTKNPKLNICILGHPWAFITLIKEEIENFDDGLFQRFLMCCLEPPIVSLKEIRKKPSSKISIVAILYLIFKLNETPQIYKLDKEACDRYDSIYDVNREIVSLSNNVDSFIGAMFGKSSTHLLRLCEVIDSDKRILTNQFREKIENELKQDSFIFTEISLDTILLSKGYEVAAYSINRTTHISVPIIHEACLELEKLELGTIIHFSSANKIKTFKFVKSTIEQVETNFAYAETFRKCGVNFSDFRKSFELDEVRNFDTTCQSTNLDADKNSKISMTNETENEQLVIQNSNSKRSNEGENSQKKKSNSKKAQKLS
ncbi:unnamed protein product [Brachionus calyciflorus]|uniref:DUF3987 domain-containing protein n=1 Tax=Brachionus calyciflorus TaxID=104777 RepID=A0A814NEF1_9BILA|nr:unnamed protein product [Brachionus calyciflorus]